MRKINNTESKNVYFNYLKLQKTELNKYNLILNVTNNKFCAICIISSILLWQQKSGINLKEHQQD